MESGSQSALPRAVFFEATMMATSSSASFSNEASSGLGGCDTRHSSLT